jgi:adenylyltransferase/sulfurtransferase
MSQPSTNPVSTLDANGLPKGYAFRPAWEITPRQVKKMLDHGEEVLLIDCRTPEEQQKCRIMGAKLMPLQQMVSMLDDLEDDKFSKIVVFCHHGVRSLQMTSVLRAAQFADVKSMAGGIDLWSIDIDPTVPRY